MNQGKLDVVKQEMVRVNTDILWMRHILHICILEGEWANLIHMTILSTTVGKNPLEEIELPS